MAFPFIPLGMAILTGWMAYQGYYNPTDSTRDDSGKIEHKIVIPPALLYVLYGIVGLLSLWIIYVIFFRKK